MSLTAVQRTSLRNDIATVTATINGVQIKDMDLLSGDRRTDIANWYNGVASPDFFGNYATVPINDVKNAITLKNYTPADVVPSSGNTTQITNDLLNWVGRALFCQGYQINVNNLLTAGTIIDATKANIVAAWKDATNTNMPSGASGANQKGGWSTIQTILCRKGTRLEKLLADTSLANGSTNLLAATFTFEGSITEQDIV